MIHVENLTYTYPHTPTPALADADLTIPDGAFVLVVGVSGSGKSTLLRAINGLVPHFYGGRFQGRVLVDGLDTLASTPRQLAGKVGFVFQDPTTQFVVQRVEDEIAFGLENLAVPSAEMSTLIHESLGLVGAEHLRQRQIATLSGGEAQRVAIACALAMRPQVLILDEPTSQLDPAGADALLDVLGRLNQDQRLTLILAEHRLTRVLPFATHILHCTANQPPRLSSVEEALPTLEGVPLVQAAQRMGWQPLPRSIKAARQLAQSTPIDSPLLSSPPPPRQPLLDIQHLSVSYAKRPALQEVNLTLHAGECVALLGSNGAGKSTLLKALAGLVEPISGQITYQGQAITRQRVDQRARFLAYVPQDPNTLLFADTLLDELRFTLDGLKLPPVMEPRALLQLLRLESYAERYPRDLSGGERQRAALAAMLIVNRPILLLDEPTLGLDYIQRETLVYFLRQWGQTVLLATHDLELAARVADRVVILEHGRIHTTGPTRDVLLHTSGYQTELAQIFDSLLTMDDWQE